MRDGVRGERRKKKGRAVEPIWRCEGTFLMLLLPLHGWSDLFGTWTYQVVMGVSGRPDENRALVCSRSETYNDSNP